MDELWGRLRRPRIVLGVALGACAAAAMVTLAGIAYARAGSSQRRHRRSPVLSCQYDGCATITVKKTLVPSSDAGRFDLKVESTVVKAAAGDGDSGSVTVDPGTYTVSEAGSGPTSLGGYSSSISCSNGASGSGTSLQVTVADSDQVTCTITNQQQTTITVKKTLVPSSDAGRFDLKVGKTVVKAAAADGDSGSRTVAPGTWRVSEAGSVQVWAAYTSSVSCSNGASGSGTHLQVTVSTGDQVTCTVTNHRKATITVKKTLVPSSDAGRFDLKVGKKIVKAAAADGDSGSRTLGPSAWVVSEAGSGQTNLANYSTSISCSNGKSGSGRSLRVRVAAADQVTCTITNRRKATIICLHRKPPLGRPCIHRGP